VGTNGYMAGFLARLDPMTNGILHERLQEQERDYRFLRSRLNVLFNFQAVTKASAFDFQVTVEEGDFFAERDLLRLGLVEAQAQQLAQSRDHAVSRFRVLMDESGNGVKSVEQKMRVKLHAQCVEPGHDQLA